MGWSSPTAEQKKRCHNHSCQVYLLYPQDPTPGDLRQWTSIFQHWVQRFCQRLSVQPHHQLSMIPTKQWRSWKGCTNSQKASEEGEGPSPSASSLPGYPTGKPSISGRDTDGLKAANQAPYSSLFPSPKHPWPLNTEAERRNLQRATSNLQQAPCSHWVKTPSSPRRLCLHQGP